MRARGSLLVVIGCLGLAACEAARTREVPGPAGAAGAAGAAGPFQGGAHHPFLAAPGGGSAAPGPFAWREEVAHPGATYLALHFASFDLGPDAVLRVSDPQGGQAYELRGRGKLAAGTFWSQHIKGEVAVLELVAPARLGRPFFVIDEYVAGRVPPPTDAICGADDKRPAACYRDSHPTEYARGRAVARLLSGGSGFCTGWLVGPDNLLLTNQHCIGDAAAARDTDYEFLAEVTECGGATPAASRIFSGAELVKVDANYDFALVRVSGNPAAEFGFLAIDNRPAQAGEEIYLLGHPGGRLKEFTIASTYAGDTGGVARVQSVSESPCMGAGYSDVGYHADTEGGNSGSPVLARSSHQVIALHHCANCPNRGVPIDLVYQQIQEHLVTSRGVLSLDAATYGCTSTVTVLLRDRDLVGTEPTVTVTSSAGESEALTLQEAGSGVFRGQVELRPGDAVPSDGIVAVAHGVTFEVRYEDLNVGDGTAGVSVAAGAVDCVAPVITEVGATARARAATVVARTDEPATLHVRYGASCDALALAAAGPLGEAHAVVFAGLTPVTTYFYAVEATDGAGNTAIDDQGGTCYAFTTPAAPDTFFTEEFAGALDLANTALRLTPNGSPNFYAGCGASITALPTDPAGGTPLALTDDASLEIIPSRPVVVFGRPLASLWVGSNGYVSAARDTTYRPTLAAHFQQLRVAALFRDLNPAQGGEVSWRELPDRIAVTWRDVPAYGTNGGRATFQIELYFDGPIRLSWLAIGVTGALVGLAEGLAQPEGYVPTDLSGLAACP